MDKQRFAKLLNLKPDIQAGDETQMANNPRNMLADAVNPLLEEYVNPVLPEAIQMAIPKMTVAEDKQYYAGLPEQMAGATMGSVKDVGAKRFVNVFGEKAADLGKVDVIDDVAKSLGKVEVQPSAADLAADVAKAKMGNAPLKAQDIMSQVEAKYGPELAKRKADMKKGLVTPDAYNSFKQEMVNKVRRGE